MTQAEYARHRGVSREAVRKAVRDRRIHMVNGKIDPAAADRAWKANTDPTKPSNSVNGHPKAAGRGPRRGKKRSSASPAPAAAADPTPAGESDDTYRDFARARVDEKQWTGRLKELEFKRKTGELIERAEVEKVFFEAANRAKERLAGIPARLAPKVARMTEESDCLQAIDDEVRLVCSELSASFGR